ncbi:MAG: hypothetical protein IPN90_07265 [Elusimicrobia bacterium]|nr:hypothetical protein [Elusimicrobiota bacterium]
MGSDDHKILTKTAYEHLVAAVGKMLEEGKKAGQQADSSLAKIYWNRRTISSVVRCFDPEFGI